MNQPALLQKTWFLFVLFTVLTVLVTVPGYFQTIKTFHEGGIQYTSYNNYIIFKQSFYHLINQKDLYQLYPQEHWDLYKYSPAFALLMAPLAVLPDFAGLLIWNLLNVLILTWAFRKLPLLTMRQKWMMLGFVLLELITSIQNEQSNALIAGLLILAFVQLENKNIFWAALFIVLTVAIKLFGLVGFAMFLFYPQKLKAALYTVLWIVFFAFIPLLVVDADQLIYLYKSWWQLLKNDHSASYGLSVAGWLYAWFGVDFKNLTVIAGVLLFCIPLLRLNLYNHPRFRALMLASVLLWVVIFNHKAESPTFIIAVSGAAIWFFYQEQNWLNRLLMLFTFIFTILSPTDLFPKTIRESFVIPYVLKAVPCIFIWIKLVTDLLTMKPALQSEQSITGN